ncbi:MAG: HAD family hydrolase [Clostridia bacterium]|nr:HAD family hydrolase [Clostridia bacterium]
MIRLIASDLDGTLMRDDRSVPDEFYRLYAGLKARGVTFVAASGNQSSTLCHVLEPIQDELTYISDNGGLIVRENQLLHDEPIPEAALLASLELLRQFPQCLPVCSGRAYSLVYEHDRPRAQPALIYLRTHRYVPDLREHLQGIYKLAICNLTGDVAEDAEALRPMLPDGLRLVTSGNGWMDITSAAASKGNALAWLQREMDISPDETMAFGDQMNDADMMRRARYSFAMANADPNLKRVAKFVAPSNQQDGVVQVLRRVWNGEFE